MLGVREYVMFDPEADCLDPPLQAFRLGDDAAIPSSKRRSPSVKAIEAPASVA